MVTKAEKIALWNPNMHWEIEALTFGALWLMESWPCLYQYGGSYVI